MTIERAQQVLYGLGYLVIPGVNIKHIEHHKKTDTYYLCASLALPSLKNALRRAESSSRRHEYLAFCMVVFHSILATTGGKITCQGQCAIYVCVYVVTCVAENRVCM
ncbi:hypothetical protein EON63_11025 [archaeon]|nr:MAG: hypothetical protein EON63_11025 [archaeon]